MCHMTAMVRQPWGCMDLQLQLALWITPVQPQLMVKPPGRGRENELHSVQYMS